LGHSEGAAEPKVGQVDNSFDRGEVADNDDKKAGEKPQDIE